MSLRILAFILILSLPGLAGALPADIVGFGNSITCWDCDDGSYLVLLEDWGYIGSAEDASYGVSADRTIEVLGRLEDWILGEGVWEPLGPQTADSLILLTGTPDTYQAVGGWKDRPYNPTETLGNIEAMIQLVLGVGIPLTVVAPPPVLDPCGYPDVRTCDEIDADLANLAAGIELLLDAYPDAYFLDLYAIFQADSALRPAPRAELALPE